MLLFGSRMILVTLLQVSFNELNLIFLQLAQMERTHLEKSPVTSRRCAYHALTRIR